MLVSSRIEWLDPPGDLVQRDIGNISFEATRFDYAEVRDLAEPKVPEAPLLTRSGQPDLKIYDRLLTVSLAAAGVCA